MRERIANILKSTHRLWLRLLIMMHPLIKWWRSLPWEKLEPLKKLNPFLYIKRMDWYIIKKFIGTYIYSIVLIISISIVFDINENLAKFTTNHAPLRAIVFDY